MPYIITTGTLEPAFAGHDQRIDPASASRTAVATLDEARENVRAVVVATPRIAGVDFDKVDALSTDGGTVGPLPDGTIIKVKRVTLAELADLSGWAEPADQFVDETKALRLQLAAFNAQQ